MILVLGKGGVGKTTTAGALALALADAGRTVHLLSTDPAHSLGDLFGLDLSGGSPTPSPCTDALLLEELDARAYAEAWIGRARAPLVELFDRGTYLDREDVEGFLDLTLPGVDEVAAALRLAELAAGEADRIVVDTAPTGHALRMLGADEVVASWARAFGAMEAKAAAVLEGLLRRRVRLESEEVVADLEDRVERFREAVRSRGCAVVVDRSGPVVRSETDRLVEALGEWGVRVSLRIRTAEPGEEPAQFGAADGPESTTVTVPFRADLQGCDGLRAWGRPTPSRADATTGPPDRPAASAGNRAGRAPAAEAAQAPPGARTEASGMPGAEVMRSLGLELLLFVGKGGVGKSTWATATALLLAEAGPVALLGTDPAGSLADLLGDAGERPAGPAGPRVRQIDAETRFLEVRNRYREDVTHAFDALVGGAPGRADAALDRRVVGSLMDLAPPGIDEIFGLVGLLEDARDEATLVVDTAPTGHAVHLLALPSTALDWTRQLLRTLRKYRAVLGLDSLAERLLDFAKRLKDLHLKLTDPARSGAIVVTQPGPLVAAETARLLDSLGRGGIRVAALARNRWPAEEAGTVDPPAPARILRAPSLSVPPMGADALLAFTRRWSVER